MNIQNNSFTDKISWIISILALLLYSVVALYGLEYLVNGNHVVAFAITIVGATLLGLCVWGICRCKLSRDKRRAIPIGILAFLGMVSILVMGSWPVTLFLYSYDHKKDLSVLMLNTRNYALGIDSLYHDYAEVRVATFEKNLKKKLYNKKNNHGERIQREVNSLRRRILSPVEDTICSKRIQWLSTIPERGLATNISTAKNLRDVFYAANKWIREYQHVSAVYYAGEEVVPFNCDEYTASANEEYKKFCVLKKPEMRSLLAMSFCIISILCTYFFSWRPKSRYSNRR